MLHIEHVEGGKYAREGNEKDSKQSNLDGCLHGGGYKDLTLYSVVSKNQNYLVSTGVYFTETVTSRFFPMFSFTTPGIVIL